MPPALRDAIVFWREGSYNLIQSHLLFGNGTASTIRNEENLSNIFEMDRPIIPILNMYSREDGNDQYRMKNRLENILVNPRFNNLIQNINDPSWLITYRLTRYFNSNSMIVSDNDDMEFRIGQNIRNNLYLASAYSNTLGWSYFYDEDDPCYVFEFVFNCRDNNKFIFIENPGMEECEILFNKNVNPIIFDISVKNIKINKNNTIKYRNKYVISCIILSDEEVENISNAVDIEEGFAPIFLDDIYTNNQEFGAFINSFDLNKKINKTKKGEDIKKGKGSVETIEIEVTEATSRDESLLDKDDDTYKSKYYVNVDSSSQHQSDIFYKKYYKYKNKYLELKKRLNR